MGGDKKGAEECRQKDGRQADIHLGSYFPLSLQMYGFKKENKD